MRALLVVLVIAIAAALPSLAYAEPETHAVGGWVEFGLDIPLVSRAQLGVASIVEPHLVIGGQGERLAVGVEVGIVHLAGASTSVATFGPVLRYTVTARGPTELAFAAALTADVGLASGSATDGGPTRYSGQLGVEVRHWIDRHLTIGGGVAGYFADITAPTSLTDLGITGTFHVGGVF
jgi:hypothetical protein